MSRSPTPPTDPLLSSNEAGAALGVTGASVRRWVRDGLVVPSDVTASGYYSFRLSDLQRQRDAMKGVRLPARRYEVVDGKRKLIREEGDT